MSRQEPGLRAHQPVVERQINQGNGLSWQRALSRLRPIISLILLGYVLSRLEVRQLVSLWPQLRLAYLLLAITLGTSMVLLSAYKWQVLVRAQGFTVSLTALFRFYLVGTFFNLFLPTSVGGDVRRVYDLARACGDPEAAAASVLLDRATGVLAMLIIGGCSVLFVPPSLRIAALAILATAGIGLLALGSTIFFASARSFWQKTATRLLPNVFSSRVTSFLDMLFRYRTAKQHLGVAVAMALLFQTTSVYIVYLLSRGLGLSVPLTPFFLFVPLVTLATMLPISLNGVGVQETGYVLLFGQIGLSTAAAFSLSLLFHLYRASIGAMGGLVYAAGELQQESRARERTTPIGRDELEAADLPPSIPPAGGEGIGGQQPAFTPPMRGPTTVGSRRGESDRYSRNRIDLLLPLAIGTVGLLLRAIYLRQAAPFVDEPSTLLVAQSILQQGKPALPSGLFYGHDLPFSYLAALFVAVLGPRVESIRWLSLVASGGTLAMFYLWGRRRFSAQVGVWAMAIWAVIPDAVVWGARGRSYALLQLLVLATCVTFAEGVLADDRPWLRRLSWALLLIAVFTHAEAALLFGPLLVSLIWSRGWRSLLRPTIIAEAGLTTIGIGVRFGLQRFIALGQGGSFGTLAGSRPAIEPLAHLAGGLVAVSPFFTAPDRLPLTLLVLLAAPAARSSLPQAIPSTIRLLFLALLLVPAQMILLVGATWQSPRYLLQLLPLFSLLAAVGLANVTAWTGPRLSHTLPHQAVTAAIALAILLLGSPGAWAAANQVEVDYRASFAYVREHAAPIDRIVTPAPAEAIADLGRVDYFAMTSGYEEFVMQRDGRWVDRWMGVPLIGTASEMATLLSRPETTWFVTDSSRLYTRYDPAFVQLVWDRMALVDANARALVFRSEPPGSFAVEHERADRFENGLLLTHTRIGSPGQRGTGEWGQVVAAPQQPLPVELVWERVTPVASTPQLFLHLVGRDGRFYSQIDRPLLRNLHPTAAWRENTRYPDRYLWNLPADLPPGRYRVDAGLYRLTDGTGWPVTTNGVVADQITLDYVVVPPPDGAATVLALPHPPTFGATISLRGVSPPAEQLTPRGGLPLSLTLLWQAETRPDRDYTLFVHLVDGAGAVGAQVDGQPLGGFYPTSFWDPGEEVRDMVNLALPEDLPAGRYTIRLGWYLPDTGRRLPLADGTDAFTLAEVWVES